MSAAQPRGADVGAIFVEALIASAIVAMALATTLRIVADGAIRDRALSQRREAILVAQSQLAAVGVSVPLQVGQSSGVEGDLAWRADVAPYGSGGGLRNPAGSLWTVAVHVAPRGGGADLVVLNSLRLGSGR